MPCTFDELELMLDQLMEEEARKFLDTVPHAAHLTDQSQPLDEAYYVRHRIETVKRIRLTAKVDALALARMIDEDYEAARQWSRYASQELSHDLLYLEDLRHHGYSERQVDATEPFPATREMLRYLEESIERFGAIAAVAYSLFVEWNSARYSRKAVAKAASHFSRRFVKGSQAHVAIDDELDHYYVMADIAHRLSRNDSDQAILVTLIRRIASSFRDYFTQLYWATVGAPEAAVHDQAPR